MRRDKILSFVIAMTVFIGVFLSSCEAVENSAINTDLPKKSGNENETLVIATSQLSGVFSPFSSTLAYDLEVVGMVCAKLIGNDVDGTPRSELCEYIPPYEVVGDDGNIERTIYTFRLKDSVKFSDGTPITADDIIFTYKVLCDPNYNGASSFYSTPILGINEYRYDDPDYAVTLEELKKRSKIVGESQIEERIFEIASEDMIINEIDDIVKKISFKNNKKLSGEKLREAVLKSYVDYELDKNYNKYKTIIVEENYRELEAEYISRNLSGGRERVPNIEGIRKLDERTVEVTIDGVDPKAIWSLGGIGVVSMNYYGTSQDGTKFSKGRFDIIEEKNRNPMGAGAYRFEKFENNVVTLRANSHYFKGKPQIPTIKIQVCDNSNKLEGVKRGDFDISDPSATPEMIDLVEKAGLPYSLVDFLGYGYIGINAKKIPDIYVRKGLMSLINRAPAVNTYYGNTASLLERTMSKISWAYPVGVSGYYYFSAKRALEYFMMAGYEQVFNNNKVQLLKNGKQLKIEIGIAGDGTMDHPVAPIVTQMKQELEKLGGVLVINDCDSSILFDRLNAGGWDMWTAAWQAGIDPDLYQTYHTNGASNHYYVSDGELDALIMQARQTTDIPTRKRIYAQALDQIMDLAIEMPIYQRSDMYIFNPKMLDVSSLPEKISPYYGIFAEIENLRLLPAGG